MTNGGTRKGRIDDNIDYADYLLGKDIEKCIIETGQCYFNAEI